MTWGVLFASHSPEWHTWLRVIALVLLSMATGLMVRFYIDQRPNMPTAAFAAHVGFAVALIGAVIYQHRERSGVFQWWLSPFIIVGSVCVIFGTIPGLHHRPPKETVED